MTVSETETTSPPLVDGWSIAILVASGLLPFADFLRTNVARMVNPATVLIDAGVWIACTLAVFLLIRLRARRSPPFPIALAIGVFNLSFWNYSRWLPLSPPTVATHAVALGTWVLVTAAVTYGAFRIAKVEAVRIFAVLFLGLWCASLLVGTGTSWVDPASAEAPTAGPALEIDLVERPNVYWLILDAHPRSDQLLRLTGSDNSWFGADLEARGFSVSSSSYAAYPQTHLSVSSTLAMDYLWLPGNEVPNELAAASPIVGGANPVVETFERNGYRYVAAPVGWLEWQRCPDPAPTGAQPRTCITPDSGPFALSEPNVYLAEKTPFGSFGLRHASSELSTFSAHLDDELSSDVPMFFYAHLLSPHFPYRYGDGCARNGEPFDVGGLGDRAARAATVANEVQCLDHDVLAFVDDIIDRDPTAVIAIQSDHGSQVDFAFDLGVGGTPDPMLEERFAALNAIRLPEGCRDTTVEGEPLVNTFRIIFGCLGATEVELLPSRSFLTPRLGVAAASEITDRLGDEP